MTYYEYTNKDTWRKNIVAELRKIRKDIVSDDSYLGDRIKTEISIWQQSFIEELLGK